jgi:hypothetical protein
MATLVPKFRLLLYRYMERFWRDLVLFFLFVYINGFGGNMPFFCIIIIFVTLNRQQLDTLYYID